MTSPASPIETPRNLLSHSKGFNRCVFAREGYTVYNHHDIYIGQAIERYGEYSLAEAEVLTALVRPGAVVVEAGANIGVHTQALARAVGSEGFVYAYEPQRIVFQTLCANLALNSLMNVDARHAALGREPGYVRIPDIDYARPDNFGGISLERFSQGRKVRIVVLDEDVETERLDLLKVDVEGMELEVLEGAGKLIRRFRPVLYVENDRQEKSEALIAHLLGLNYRLYWHFPPLFNENNFYRNPQNTLGNVVSVNMLCVPREAGHQINGAQEITDARAVIPVR